MFDNNNYPGQIDDIEREIRDLRRKREELIQSAQIKPMEPKDQQLVTLAHEAGEMTAMYRLTAKKVEDLEKAVISQNEKIDRLSDRDEWRDRALKAEESIKRRRKR